MLRFRPIHSLFILISLSLSTQLLADNYSTQAGDYTIYHTVFNSSFLTPEVASAYGFTRGTDKALVNVAVTSSSAGGLSRGLPAVVSGTARNLMQQQTPLKFQTIEEQDATYYLAPFEFDDQEIMHFYIDVEIPAREGQRAQTKRIEFTQKMYED